MYNKSDNIYFSAPDLGNSWTDVITLDGTSIGFPSLVAPGRVQRYSHSFGDDFNRKSSVDTTLDKLWLQDDSGTFFIGYNAYDQTSPEKIKLSHDTQNSFGIKQKLLRTAMGLTLPQQCEVRLVLGHPYAESHLSPQMISMAKGIHRYTLNGVNYYHDVIEVITGSQPVFAFRGTITDLNGQPRPEYVDLLNVPTLVIDIGGGTWDYCLIERNRRTGMFEVKDHLSDSKRFGTWYATEIIREEIYTRYQVDKVLVELEYELKNGDEILIDGNYIDIGDIKREAYRQTVADGITFTTNLINTNIRSRVGKVLATGGGSIEFESFLIPHFTDLFGDRYQFVSKDVIARGQWSKAKQLWGETNG